MNRCRRRSPTKLKRSWRKAGFIVSAEDWSEDEIRDRLAAMEDTELDGVLSRREVEALRQGYREHITDFGLPHIRELPQVLPDLFAAAARRVAVHDSGTLRRRTQHG